jgi:hypothetical protein
MNDFVQNNIIFSRAWAMPNLNTFSILPIKNFVLKYLEKSKISVDSFSRDSNLCTFTNDLNSNTCAKYHYEAEEFHKKLMEWGIKVDLCIFDWPYSPRQIKECYNGIGKKMQMEDGQTARLKKRWKESILPVLTNDAVVLTFGWNTVGMGKKLGFKIEEILLVCHGGDHNDTICVAERKI